MQKRLCFAGGRLMTGLRIENISAALAIYAATEIFKLGISFGFCVDYVFCVLFFCTVHHPEQGLAYRGSAAKKKHGRPSVLYMNSVFLFQRTFTRSLRLRSATIYADFLSSNTSVGSFFLTMVSLVMMHLDTVGSDGRRYIISSIASSRMDLNARAPVPRFIPF